MPSGLGAFGIAGGDGRIAAGLGCRSIDVAVGVQYRKEKLSNSYSDLLTSGFAGFLGPNRNTAFQRDVKSVFAEANYELIDRPNINAAARYEDNGNFDTVAPKNVGKPPSATFYGGAADAEPVARLGIEDRPRTLDVDPNRATLALMRGRRRMNATARPPRAGA